MAPLREQMFYIGLYGENMEKSSCLKPEGIDYWYLVYSFCSNCSPGAKNGPVQMVTRFTGKREKIFLSETTRPRALIFGM